MTNEPRQKRERFKQSRRLKGTQNEVGLAMGVTGTMIRFIENGNATPSGKLMIKLSNYFGVSVNELFPDVEKQAIEEVSCRN
jgi:DNA-binding XRE family transcriptional regulator